MAAASAPDLSGFIRLNQAVVFIAYFMRDCLIGDYGRFHGVEVETQHPPHPIEI